MTNCKSTKRALLASALALLVCVSMLVGTTFAWFTDSVTSSGNKIVAGKLDVELYMHNGTSYVDISDDTAPIFGGASSLMAQNNNANTLWEPGKTQVAYLMIKNAGNLALKYTVALDVKNATKDLYKVMQYAVVAGATANAVTGATPLTYKGVDLGIQTVSETELVMNPGTEHYFALAVHMDEEANNAYQGGSVDFDLTVLATQATVEADSFGTEYDKYAAYANTSAGKIEQGVAAKEFTVNDKNDVKVATVVVPAEAVAAPDTEIKIEVTPSVYEANITVDTGMETVAYDVEVTGLKENNDVPVKVKLKIPAGLDPATVKLYHYELLIPSTYNPITGYVEFESATFSPFTVVYDAESEYVAPEVDVEDAPESVATPAPEYVGKDINWGSYGNWAPTEGLDAKLETAYTFKCQETLEEAKANPFANWACDFYVSLDRDLEKNQIFLGGNYGKYGWVGFHNGDFTLPANTEIGLLDSVTSNAWTYLDVVKNVKTFICGAGDVNDALKGATFTVKLRLTNPQNEKEFYDVETIKYTF